MHGSCLFIRRRDRHGGRGKLRLAGSRRCERSEPARRGPMGERSSPMSVNTGYATTILEQYLENPESVPSEWRALFESGDTELVRELPGLARLLESKRPNGGNGGGPATAAAAPPPVTAPPAPPSAVPDELLLGGVAAAMALVKAHRMHGHLAAHLDPLGSEPVGDPALEPERLVPKLTPELQ